MALEISVIVPTYNRAELIRETLTSILNQSHRPAEVIVVDDGSSDDTEAAVKMFGMSVRYIRIENSGECRARNIGVSHSTTPWIAFCDSDDLWHPDKLMLQAKLVRTFPDVSYSFTNFCTVVDDQWSVATKFDSSPARFWNVMRCEGPDGSFVIEQSMFSRLLRHQPVFPSTLLMTRDFFEAVGRWNEPLGRTPSVDLEFHLRCAEHPPIGVVSAAVVGIRKHGSNFSGNPLKTNMGEIEILRYVLSNNSVAQRYAAEINEQIVLRFAAAADGAFSEGNLALARKFLGQLPYCRRSWKHNAKYLIANAPSPVGHFVQRLTTGVCGH